MKPTVGRIVHYRLSEQDVERINAMRADAGGSGNTHNVGDVVPLIIVRVWGSEETSAFNGRAILDGPHPDLWVTSTCFGDGPRQCAWPPRA